MKCNLIQGNRFCIALTAKVNRKENTSDFHAKYNQLVKHVDHQNKGKKIFYTKNSYSRTKGDYQEEAYNAFD